MTTPGGVPNLPQGALTLDTLGTQTQDMSPAAMKARAAGRFPAIMDSSTGLSPALDFTPSGIITSLFSGFNSTVANADPADIDGPEDLPGLLIDFIESLPVVGQFVTVFEAFLGTYDGDDPTLLGIQALFAPLRLLIGLIPGLNQVLALIGLGTSGTPGGNPLDPLLGLLNQGLQDIGNLWAQLFGQQSTGQAQIDALASGGFIYDTVANGVSGWSNLVGTLALSTRGAFIQPTTETVSYRASGLSVDKYGVNFVIDPTMQGVAGAGICADSAGASWVGLLAYRGFDGDALWLVSAASPTLWVVQKQIDLLGVNRLSGPTTLDLRTDGVNKFSVKLNGQPVAPLDWTDGFGIATHNSTHRGVILLTNGLNRSEDSFNGPAIKGKVVSYAA